MNVRIDDHYDLSQAELWEAVTDPERLSAWLGGSCTIEPRVGGEVRFDLAADGVAAIGVVRQFEPPRPDRRVAMLSHTWVADGATSQCTWAVIRDQDDDDHGCRLEFVHDGVGESDGDAAARAWRTRLGLEGQRTTPLDELLAVLDVTRTVLLVSYIGPEIPDTLAEAGFDVVVKTGPGPDDWSPARPTRVDLVHLDVGTAFDEYLAVAVELGAHTFWYHSARTRPPAPADNRGCWVPAPQAEAQRRATEAAGLRYVDDRYLADVVRRWMRTSARH